ncbi:MAG: S-layer homology domain-containing protein, partial [Oscillospiraceae bacterium]|nr:S-layer homology domain-containing protein [Oscillospiraceae bacterium]MDY5736277.1 S-layer homology domain-containing protein [Oscillospiraceae bacterium]
DIKYTVPVDGSVVFKAADFQDFYDDTHKNGTLSYVKFTELPKVTDGALYATYSAIYAGTVAKTSDKFYYDSSKASDYDLDDVTFRTSMWSKAGTKIYIPFEAYGTTSKTSKTVSGTPVKGWVAITVENARTMNFTDVKTSDWFYNNVKNAYTMGLIEGKTTTTFNPDDNMTYAEAVTLAARMNQLYYSGKVTLSNSTTGNWYSSYESYAISKGIISSALGNKANTKITRKDYVDIFYNALPASAYTVRNTVSSIPDLANNTANAKVYAFYRAGILTGYANTPGKTNGAFGPNDNIKRSEVATILIRMMDSGTRVYFTM